MGRACGRSAGCGGHHAKGSSREGDGHRASPKIYARFRDGNRQQGGEFYAMVDTGAAYTNLHVDLANELGVFELPSVGSAAVGTAHGRVTGTLVQYPLIIEADSGVSLTVHAIVLASQNWRGPNIVGYGGLLERLRFAFEPAGAVESRDRPRWFFDVT